MTRQHERRRTFAIISHPDAGKTTLTEKLLLYGGAIHMAGAVKSRKARRTAVSDWMQLEKERGISVTSSVMQFDFADVRWNLLDTPGHNDFSEDTYRTLTAADCAIMILDAAKGVEPQTRKLFHVCSMRGTPIVTFVNKMDRPTRDTFDLMGEVEEVLGVHTVPFTWPIGSGDLFQGVYDRQEAKVVRFAKGNSDQTKGAEAQVTGLHDPELASLLGSQAASTLQDELELLDGAGEEYDRQRFLAGQITPVFFGSALTSFGVEPFLRSFKGLCPPPGPRKTSEGELVQPDDDRFSAFVFKIQANMDPAHRDRIAFARVCSGEFEAGMRVHHSRAGKQIRLNHSEQFFAQERETVRQAYAGDIVGLYDPGIFHIGDTLSSGKPISFDAVPRFSPEHFARVRLRDPMKRKQLQRGLQQLAEEGTIQIFMQPGQEKDPICGVVGKLQFDVLTFRLEREYGARIGLDPLPYSCARWVEGPEGPNELEARRIPVGVLDRDGHPVALFHDELQLNRAIRNNPEWTFHENSPLGNTAPEQQNAAPA